MRIVIACQLFGGKCYNSHIQFSGTDHTLLFGNGRLDRGKVDIRIFFIKVRVNTAENGHAAVCHKPEPDGAALKLAKIADTVVNVLADIQNPVHAV